MGRIKDMLIEFEGIWDSLVGHAHTGVEADMVAEVAEVLGTFVEIWTGGGKHWVVPAGLFQGLVEPIEVSPNFRRRVNAYLDALQEEAFEEWVAAMEADAAVQAMALTGGAA
jgi:hypothetical protein